MDRKPSRKAKTAAQNREAQRKRTANWRRRAQEAEIARIEVWAPLSLRNALRLCLRQLGFALTPRAALLASATDREQWEARLRRATKLRTPEPKEPVVDGTKSQQLLLRPNPTHAPNKLAAGDLVTPAADTGNLGDPIHAKEGKAK